MNFKTVREAEAYVGGLGNPSKMPGLAYGLPAAKCSVGSALVKVPGSVCSGCYALKGRYVFPNVLAAQYRRLETIHREHWVEAMVFLLTKKKVRYFRWHDSGDLQSIEHLQNIIAVARQCPDVHFWLPTRETKIARHCMQTMTIPYNLVIRVSGTMIDGPRPIGFVNTSTVTKDPNKVTCPAHKQNNTCGACRACWDPAINNVAYPKH